MGYLGLPAGFVAGSLGYLGLPAGSVAGSLGLLCLLGYLGLLPRLNSLRPGTIFWSYGTPFMTGSSFHYDRRGEHDLLDFFNFSRKSG